MLRQVELNLPAMGAVQADSPAPKPALAGAQVWKQYPEGGWLAEAAWAQRLVEAYEPAHLLLGQLAGVQMKPW